MNKKKINYTEAPKNISRAISEGKIVTDFLPPPGELIKKEPKVKITIKGKISPEKFKNFSGEIFKM
jgi:hypothetical protein